MITAANPVTAGANLLSLKILKTIIEEILQEYFLMIISIFNILKLMQVFIYLTGQQPHVQIPINLA